MKPIPKWKCIKCTRIPAMSAEAALRHAEYHGHQVYKVGQVEEQKEWVH